MSTCTYRRQVRIKGGMYWNTTEDMDEVNKNDYIMSTGDMNARVENNKVTSIVGTNGEAAFNNNGKNWQMFAHSIT